MQVVDPRKASYGVENAIYAVVQLAQTTMRSELGKITLDKTFEVASSFLALVETYVLPLHMLSHYIWVAKDVLPCLWCTHLQSLMPACVVPVWALRKGVISLDTFQGCSSGGHHYCTMSASVITLYCLRVCLKLRSCILMPISKHLASNSS